MNFRDINFPIYSVGSHKKLWCENNILYLLSDSDIIYKVDNKNLPYDTIGKRRLRIHKKELYKFTGTYFSLVAVIKSNKKLFIDNTGKLINYKKSKTAKLEYIKIKRVVPVDNKGLLIYMYNKTAPLLVSNLVYNKEKYVGILDNTIVYDFSTYKKENTWRKI